MIKTKRAYDSYDPKDGRRVLVDRLWPRGLTREKVRIDSWMQDIAPSSALRKWFAHDPGRWGEFKLRYRQELETRSEVLKTLQSWVLKGDVTLLYAAKDEAHNNALALKEVLEDLAKRKKRQASKRLT